jgi:hypothetical protein
MRARRLSSNNQQAVQVPLEQRLREQQEPHQGQEQPVQAARPV